MRFLLTAKVGFAAQVSTKKRAENWRLYIYNTIYPDYLVYK
ncbi:hypothetical protein SAMN04487764_2152 [Gillisia sp. Hel1_33_143]|nr:hypothetical protein [Gillisia sp. Hel1_33_143]SDS40957.1 hypothetical protein SAMN04487764_2152 [Gillisia sp. Hel1_33_143]